MKILHFRSSIGYSLYVNGEYVDVCDRGRTLDIMTKSRNITITYCPISDNVIYMPITAKMDLSAGVESGSEYIKVVPFGHDHYEVHIIPQSIDMAHRYNIVCEEKVKDISVRVYNNGHGKIDISGKDIDVNGVITMASVDEYMGYIIVECICNDDRHVAVYDISTSQVVLSTNCDKVEKSDSEIRALIDQRDILLQAVVKTYNLSTKSLDRYVIYLGKQAKLSDISIVPYAFLTAIKAGNLAKAKECLSVSYSDITDIQI